MDNLGSASLSEVPKELSYAVISSAIEVHRHLGPGLLESVYARCLAQEFRRRGVGAEQEVEIPITYKDEVLDGGFRVDFMVNRKLLVELKAVDQVLPIHEAQMLTYLKLSGIRVGLLINFNSTPLKNGIRRFVR